MPYWMARSGSTYMAFYQLHFCFYHFLRNISYIRAILLKKATEKTAINSLMAVLHVFIVRVPLECKRRKQFFLCKECSTDK